MLIIIIGTWVEETNRLILELDSRSETETMTTERYARLLEANAEPSLLELC